MFFYELGKISLLLMIRWVAVLVESFERGDSNYSVLDENNEEFLKSMLLCLDTSTTLFDY